ncbi:MAG: AI-2E family transporter [Candidatus Omnitrophica bacterium]|nr:AI-2E family transporter [Candidatus Omnitrophota bacterium]
MIPIALAAIFSSLLFPFQERLTRALKGRKVESSVIVLFLSVLMIGLPLFWLIVIAAKEALQISETVRPWLQEQMNKPVDQWTQSILQYIPFHEDLRVFQNNVAEGFSQLLQTIGKGLTGMLTAATTKTVDFFFKAFVAIYSAFFFLTGGPQMYKTVTGYLPLTEEEVNRMTGRMLLLIRATIRSLFIIGAIQGALVAVAFWFLGIKAPVFWGIMAAGLSAIPGVGAPLVWVPAVIYLVVADRLTAAIMLAIWGAFVVGLVDNLLRPIIIGKDTKIPELLIFFAILGGLSLFGLAGFILGPMVVSLLISVLEIYEKAFRKSLPGDRP